MPATEEQLQATGLKDRFLETYRLAYAKDPPLVDPKGLKNLAKQLGVVPSTVKLHLARVNRRLEDTGSLEPSEATPPILEESNPEKFADAVVALAAPGAKVARVAREVGIAPCTADKIGKKLDGELQSLGRELVDIRLEDITKRFGTLARDAVDAITPEKLLKANAQQLSIIAGVAIDKWQLLRGQPTSRMEIEDRRQMNELLGVIVKEASRRGIEIDVTPEGSVSAGKSSFRNAHNKRLQEKITSGDPVEALAPA